MLEVSTIISIFANWPLFIQVNGGWSPWTSFSECSASCAGGIKTRTRQCNSPAPDPDGLPCDANAANETVLCNTVDCPSESCVYRIK